MEKEEIRLAAIGDWLAAPTGFGTVNYNILWPLREKYTIGQLAINYSGDYHRTQRDFKFYHVGDHPLGFNKVKPFIRTVKPHIAFVLSDPWIANTYITHIRSIDPDLPAVLYTPVDSPNLDRQYVNVLNQYSAVVAYTEFGKQELIRAGLTVPCSVISHGVDTETFYPGNKQEARELLGLRDLSEDMYLVTYTGANQPRKKVDVFIWTINEWLRKYPHDNVYFYYHGALNSPSGLDVPQMLDYLDTENERLGYTFKISDRFCTTGEKPTLPKQTMRYIYQAADVYLQACANEGWGMPLHEAMACGIPSICADYSALSEWPRGGVAYVPVAPAPDAVASRVNTVHKVLDIPTTVETLERLYQDEQERKDLAARGYKIATQPKYQWANIVNEFYTIFESLRKG